MTKNEFDKLLSVGKAGESKIAMWLRSRGSTVLPVYEKLIEEGKGPTLFLPNNRNLICPDLLTWQGNKVVWIEAKHKEGFSWHRNSSRWTTGIDLRLYHHYLEMAELTPFPVWVLFLHRGGSAKDNPTAISPSGLFGNDISILKDKVSHVHPNFGRSGGAFWAMENLIKLDTLEAVDALSSPHPFARISVIPATACLYQ